MPTNTLPDNDELRKITGIGEDEEQAMDREAYNGASQDIAEREDLKNSTGEDEIPFSNTGKRRFRLTKKQGIAGGLVGLVIGGGMGIMSVIQGPLQILHAANFVTDFLKPNIDTQDSSARRLYNTVTGQGEKNRLGAMASALTTKNLDKLKFAGIETDFETADGKGRRKLQAIHVNPNTTEGKALLARVRAEGVPLPEAGPGGRITLRADIRGRDGGRLVRSLTDEMVGLAGKKGIAGAITKRRFKKLFRADFHPLSVARRTGEDFVDTVKRRRTERAERIREGTKSNGLGNPTGEVDENGNQSQVDSSVEGESNATRDLVDGTKGQSRTDRIKAFRSSSLFKGGATAAAIVAIACSVKELGDNIPEYKMLNVVQPLIRLSVSTAAAGSQVMAMQDIDMAELASVAEAFYDEETGTSWAGGKAVKSTNGEPGGAPLDPAIESQIIGSYNGEKPALFTVFDNPILGPVCGVNSWFGSLPIIKQLGDVTDSLMNGAASLATGKSIEDWMADLVGALSGEAIDVLAQGAEFGNLLAYGSHISSVAGAIAFGATDLNPAQAAEWDNYIYEQDLALRKKQGISERLFNAASPNSLIGGLVFKLNSTPAFGSISNFIRTGPISMTSGLYDGFSALLVKPTFAQTVNGYDFGIPKHGIPLSTLQSERYENMYENFDRLEDNDFAKLKEANSKWGKCFGNPLDDQGNIVDKEATGQSHEDMIKCQEDIKNNGEISSPEFQDYQMYILDNVTVKSLACYEGIDDQACQEIGFGSSSNAAGIPSTSGNADPGQDTSAMQCPAGTTDGGVHQDYGQGRVETVKIRICDVKGVTGVNASIAQNALNMINAAEAAGHNLTGSAFRSYDTQVALRTRNGCPDADQSPARSCRVPTAIPGNSLHEVGLAIDFDNMCFPRSTCPSSAAWVWLTQNASRYNFKQLQSEAWHWSPSGS